MRMRCPAIQRTIHQVWFQVRAAGFDFAESKIVFRMLEGTCSNVSGSIEYDARPFDRERMAVAYPKSSAKGTSAFRIVSPPLASKGRASYSMEPQIGRHT